MPEALFFLCFLCVSPTVVSLSYLEFRIALPRSLVAFCTAMTHLAEFITRALVRFTGLLMIIFENNIIYTNALQMISTDAGTLIQVTHFDSFQQILV